MEFLARMQKLPDEKKRMFALFFAGALTVIIAVSWFFFQYAPKGNPFVSPVSSTDTQSLQESLGKLSGQIDQASQQIASGTTLIGQLIQSAQASSTTDATGTIATTTTSTTTQSLK